MTCTPWPIRWTCDIPFEDEPELVDIAVAGAQDILFGLSGRRYGVCEVTEEYRPPCDDCLPPYVSDFGPGVEDQFGRQRRDCCKIYLTKQPARAIVSVEVDGVALDDDEFALDLNVLRRVGECWPCGDGCDEAPVKVVYEWGLDVPALGALAMGEVACELLRAMKRLDCRLPSNAVRIDRQGVSIELEPLQSLYAMNRLGLPIADQFLRSVNPNRLQSRSVVYSPDFARRSR